MKVSLLSKGMHGQSHARGIGIYAKELLHALQKNYPQDHFFSTNNKYVSYHPDLIHYPFFDPFFLTLRLDQRIRTIVTIHDLIPLKFPTHFPSGLRGKFKWLIQKSRLKKVAHIITDSECSKHDILELTGLESDRVSVVPLAPSGADFVPKRLVSKLRQEYHLPDNYLLYVGDINWNKNIPGLIECFNRLSDQKLGLVLVGKVFSDRPNISEYKEIRTLIDSSPKSTQILELGYVPTHHLGAIYAGATLYVQPSFYEGFGLPILEAMRYGCPVASSDRGSLQEIGGQAVAYFDPAKTMTTVISDLLSSPTRLKELSALGLQRAKLYSWTETAKLTHNIYEKVLSDFT